MKPAVNNPMQQNAGIIQPVLENLSAIFQIWIKYISCSGEYVITPVQEKQCQICHLIRSHPLGAQRCWEAARQSLYLSPDQHHLFTCHAGFYVLAIPLQGKRSPIGVLETGGIRLSAEPGDYERFMKNVSDLGLDERLSRQYFEELPVKKRQEVLLLGETLYAISNCFLELGSAQARIQQEKSERALLQSELQALNSQINPHFLFNTLNTIQMLSYLEGARKTPAIINALSNLLRARLNCNQLLTSLEEELAVINNLLLIQKTRFEDRLQIRIDIPAVLLDALVPSLSLQPLVENALIHGLEPSEKIGRLDLQAMTQGGDLVIYVKDNGVGMTAPEVDKIERRLRQQESNGDGSEIGIVNIHRRCLALFGDEYGIGIRSAKNRGTEMTLRIPLRIRGCESNENIIG